MKVRRRSSFFNFTKAPATGCPDASRTMPSTIALWFCRFVFVSLAVVAASLGASAVVCGWGSAEQAAASTATAASETTIGVGCLNIIFAP
jgi:hypothetical protein